MKATILKLDGKKGKSIDMPRVFSEELRPDLIRRAFHSIRSRSFQPKGADVRAGFRTTATGWGTGGGMSRIPRTKAGPRRAGRSAKGRRYRSKGRWFPAAGRGAIIPGTVGGRQAHPPKSCKILIKKMNDKELGKAMRSAIASTVVPELVKGRGHAIGDITLPLVVDDTFMSLEKTKGVKETLSAIGLSEELERSSKRSIRAGIGKLRGRKYRTKTGPLLVVPSTEERQPILRAARNMPGVTAVSVNELDMEMLAPGSHAGRLIIWTESAIKDLQRRFA
ncbi:MAG: 50S ribosomal protein L4 [archaeon]|jgi:large subunit ribosomal protein L4e|nr:50S ribosomal protein L4 [Euryarchaeota archaeon]MDP7260519.1 50S ribosomal protein L4 [archaeon]HIK01180.1 50S ribosomal protein L4 [Candidatus Undinarchaeales archaeon ERR594346 U_76725]|tara:strand:+ start:23034 stop:23870 length:837 start_codon:yes stop_codon:yes gene_type:complete